MIATRMDTRFLSELRAAAAKQLPEYLRAQRWFRAKAREIHAVEVTDCVAIRLARGRALVVLARVVFVEGPEETYVIPLLQANEHGERAGTERGVIQLREPETTSETALTDALTHPDFLAALLTGIQGNMVQAGEQGELRGIAGAGLPALLDAGADLPSGRVLQAEQSNTSVVYGDRLILKFYRRAEEGINPDLEIGRFLTESGKFARTPPLGGWLEYQTREGKSQILAILQGFVANQGDAWKRTLQMLKDLTGRAIAHAQQNEALQKRYSSAQKRKDLPVDIAEEIAGQAKLMGLLGKRTAEMHLALASPTSDPAFAAEPFTPAFRESLEGLLHDLTVRNFDLLRSKADTFPERLRPSAQEVLKLEEDILLRFHTTLENDIKAKRIRIHGDYHLGQVLCSDADFFIIDFEGEPARPVSERRAKRSALQDVAGMLRSFHYAERSALLAAADDAVVFPALGSAIARLLSIWRETVSQQFLEDYKQAASGAPFLPKKAAEMDALLRLHLLEKAIYELGYELNNRPAWVGIPLDGIGELARPTN